GVTQYLSLHPLTPWAELLRFEERTTETEADELRPPLWALRIELRPDRTLRLGFANAGDVGLAPEDLVGDDYGPCQALAAGLRADHDGPRALIVPSAALPGTENLVVLEPRVMVPYELRPVDEQDLAAALAAVDARAPYDLVDRVHQIGASTQHAGLAAFRNGDDVVPGSVRHAA
ncbi:MAG: hypothetical protein QOD81_3438, partial [Solirubrobacteraceae bacterium]|nr:hypothetical protein [Solirubrobacteraceae bacterium]